MDELESPYDFRAPALAAAWDVQIDAEAAWRSLFFDAMTRSLGTRYPRAFSVLELGSGPGRLAQAILSGTAAARYVALDYSAAMHDLAARRLGPLAARVEFAQRDFRSPDWALGLGPFDAAVTLMAAHELRRKDRLEHLMTQIAGTLSPTGRLLFADFYAVGDEDDLYLSRAGQAEALGRAGFARVELLLDANGMALYAAYRGKGGAGGG